MGNFGPLAFHIRRKTFGVAYHRPRAGFDSHTVPFGAEPQLIDTAPTILDMLGIASPQVFDLRCWMASASHGVVLRLFPYFSVSTILLNTFSRRFPAPKIVLTFARIREST